MSEDYIRNDCFLEAMFEKYPQVHPSYVYRADERAADYVAAVDQLVASQTLPSDDYTDGAEVEWIRDMLDALRLRFALPDDAMILIEAGLPRPGGKPVPPLGRQSALAGLFGDSIRQALGDHPGGQELIFMSRTVPIFRARMHDGNLSEEKQLSWPVLAGVEVGQLVQQLALQYGERCIGCFYSDPRGVGSGRKQPQWAKSVAVLRRGAVYVALPLCRGCAHDLRTEDPAVQFLPFNRHPSRR